MTRGHAGSVADAYFDALLPASSGLDAVNGPDKWKKVLDILEANPRLKLGDPAAAKRGIEQALKFRQEKADVDQAFIALKEKVEKASGPPTPELMKELNDLELRSVMAASPRTRELRELKTILIKRSQAPLEAGDQARKKQVDANPELRALRLKHATQVAAALRAALEAKDADRRQRSIDALATYPPDVATEAVEAEYATAKDADVKSALKAALLEIRKARK